MPIFNDQYLFGGLNNEKIKDTGWFPIFSLEESLKHTVQLVKDEIHV